MDSSENALIFEELRAMKMWSIILITCLISSSWAQEKSQSSSDKLYKDLSVSLESTLNSNLYKTSSTDHSLDSDVGATAVILLNNGGAVFLALAGNKDLKGERKFLMADTALGLSTPLYSEELVKISLSSTAILPTSKNSRENAHLQAGLSLAPKFTFIATDIPGLTIAVSPGFRYNLHKYNTALSGSSNTEMQGSAKLTLAYSFLEKWSLKADSTYIKRITYRGSESDVYQFLQELSYQFSNGLGLSLGHVNAGSPLAADGVTTDIDFFNERSSKVYTGIGFSF